MNMNEKGFENAFKDKVKKYWPNSRIKKIASSWMGGILDIYMKRADRPACWIELKFVDISTRKSGPPESVPLNLSGQQRQWIRDEKRVNGCAGWMVMVQLSQFDTVILSGTDENCKEIPYGVLMSEGCHGRQYNRTKEELEQVLERIYNGQ